MLKIENNVDIWVKKHFEIVDKYSDEATKSLGSFTKASDIVTEGSNNATKRAGNLT